jgi:hypothetical protein
MVGDESLPVEAQGGTLEVWTPRGVIRPRVPPCSGTDCSRTAATAVSCSEVSGVPPGFVATFSYSSMGITKSLTRVFAACKLCFGIDIDGGVPRVTMKLRPFPSSTTSSLRLDLD